MLKVKPYTNDKYWDCNCVLNYIHSKNVKDCPICGATEEEQPDSIQSEIEEQGIEK
jgi:rubrerythrin